MQSKRRENGASLVEMALLIGLIALVSLVGVRILGQNVSAQFSNTASRVGG